MIAPEKNCPPGNCPQGNCPPGKLPPHSKISLENNCHHSSKFSSKSTTSELRKAMHFLRVLLLKNQITKSYFPRMQIRSKKWFTSIYFLQILTKPWRTPLVGEHFSLNASWFSYARTQKKKEKVGGKIYSEKKIIANNNIKIFRACYMPSK